MLRRVLELLERKMWWKLRVNQRGIGKEKKRKRNMVSWIRVEICLYYIYNIYQWKMGYCVGPFVFDMICRWGYRYIQQGR
jgi:hypothetical protein